MAFAFTAARIQHNSSPIRTKLESEQVNTVNKTGVKVAGPSVIGTGIGADIKEMYSNWWESEAATMRSGEKTQGKVSWQGQDFGEKEVEKVKNWIGRAKQKPEDFQEEWNCLTSKKEHQKKHQNHWNAWSWKTTSRNRDVLHAKPLEKPMTEMSSLKRAIRGSFQGYLFFSLR